MKKDVQNPARGSHRIHLKTGLPDVISQTIVGEPLFERLETIDSKPQEAYEQTSPNIKVN